MSPAERVLALTLYPLSKYPRFMRDLTVPTMPLGPHISSSSSRPFRLMLWMSPGRPRKWSAWRCVMKILLTRMNDTEELISCLWMHSPQSNRATSGPICTAREVTFLTLEGYVPPIPRNTSFMRAHE